MLVRDFDFDLPPELIAQEPPAQRGTSRLLHLDRQTGRIAHQRIDRLPALLRSGDVLVVNNTRVFPARLLGHRLPSGGAVECLLVQRLESDSGGPAGSETWSALVHPGQKLKPGARMVFDGPAALHGEILDRHFFGRRTVRLWTGDSQSVQDAVEQNGHMPLPPYIKRGDDPADRQRYQTVYAQERGSIAAPTAGLHFTPELLDAVAAAGIEIAEVTLHVGYGTFQPVRVDVVEEHRVEPERFTVAPEAAQIINRALNERRRVVAVGTTTTRTLEHVARQHGGRLVSGEGTADLFIFPGFEFRIISGLLTNFHLPQSSLLMLAAAFGGRDAVLAAYREAVARGYRFYSYGDAMLIL
jgi:S-adenosylmethionine:tRNA ribosyltransferase-isomerase